MRGCGLVNETREAPPAVDHRFFAWLTTGHAAVLDDLLDDDFTIVAVSDGSVADKRTLLAALDDGLRFGSIRTFAVEVSVRFADSVAIAVGRTEMSFDDRARSFSAGSRYTHVYRRDRQRWRLLSAQGTPIAAAVEPF